MNAERFENTAEKIRKIRNFLLPIILSRMRPKNAKKKRLLIK